jgi:MinD superfamily P-loop ATPase
MPELDLDKCDLCGLCVDVCRCEAIVMNGESITITDTEACGWCSLCEAVCPRDAIVCAFEIVFSTDED